ncbi:haloacetate dehalogenase [Breoghania corrubedonensis]|uniref:Haloacetate dehalogenase n=1 Tax=Breoghania corrubedonensis TaxID=665038 RepID=A0A2T5VEW0_9HYPH|nr:alpha/beta hydrolase [Breoghania corrubedonensis]PTW62280.1 haloacetate dehalogenase [Breoghania corrubedonensis]
MADLPELFPGFETRMVEGEGATLHVRIGGEGMPLVLVHGYPECGVMWHKLASELSRHFTCIIPDLRGYGQSSVPKSEKGLAYSKRAMGNDIAAMMTRLGHQTFALAGHDRGARVAYRLGLDHPDRLSRLAVLDILPTYDYWRQMNLEYGLKMYHWLFLAQPTPLPENLIARASTFYLEHTLASWTANGNLSAFDKRALEHYRAFFSDPERIHAACEDYRAGAGIDMDIDTADRAAGKTIDVPLLVLWGGRGLSPDKNPLDVWRDWATAVEGQAVDGGHFLPEENPEATTAALISFFKQS